MMSNKRLYRYKKCRNVLKYTRKQLKRRKNRLEPNLRTKIEQSAILLENALDNRNREEASKHARLLDEICQTQLKKSLFESIGDSTLSLGIALAIAVVVRQTWFELYEIPTGSMRPTLREKDRLLVSKSQFGINIPLTTKHLMYKDNRVERGNIVVFTSHNMDIPDANMLYFFLFPGKKQLIKRMIGKPGDTLYFYGGKIYGVDKDGVDISHELQRYNDIDYVPYIQLDGKPITSKGAKKVHSPVVFYQMNQPIAKMDVTGSGRLRGNIIKGKSEAENYSDFWGFKNYSMSQILSKEEVRADHDLTLYNVPESEYYLVMKHHPDVRTGSIGQDRYGKMRPMLGINHSILPLKEEHLKKIFAGMYTARFTVENEKLFRWEYSFFGDLLNTIGLGKTKHKPYAFTPKMAGLPNGTYEYYNGIPYKVNLEGVLTKVKSDHPLAQYNIDTLRLFYNGGIELDEHFMPSIERYSLEPQRFTYFREGDLYSMGAQVMAKDDSLLQNFVAREMEKEETAPSYKPYEAFVDQAAPSLEIIRKFGITVPDKNYLVLGDNFAMSADSRDFGFVPESNIRGVPKMLFWPPGKRFGAPRQKGYDTFTASRVAVWVLAGVAIGSWTYYQRKRRKERLEKLEPADQES
jgi:signal peptidase I